MNYLELLTLCRNYGFTCQMLDDKQWCIFGHSEMPLVRIYPNEGKYIKWINRNKYPHAVTPFHYGTLMDAILYAVDILAAGGSLLLPQEKKPRSIKPKQPTLFDEVLA